MLQINCDESGYEGEKLIDTTKPFFAHASVTIGAEDAAELLRELRRRIRSPATAYKSGHLLREKNRSALEWFLGPDSPVRGHGNVFLIDKAHHVITQLADLLDLDPARIDRSPYFLAAANDLLRTKDRPGVVDEFFRVSGYSEGRERAELFRVWLLEDPVLNSVLDPLVPALVAAVRHWGPVTVVHDRQIMLPARRIERIRELCGGRLAGVRFADAESNPQIQIADILAGTVRHIAEHDDPVLTELAASYLDETSILVTEIPEPAAESAAADG
jgi:hypothetical protein